LQANNSIVLGHSDERLQYAFVGFNVGTSCRQFSLQLYARFNNLYGIRKECGAHRGKAAKYKVRCGHHLKQLANVQVDLNKEHSQINSNS